MAVFNKYYDQHMDRCSDTQKSEVLALVNVGNLAACQEQRKYAAQMLLLVVQMSLYEAGLLDPLRLEVSQTQYENLQEMQKAALAAEARRASKKPIVAAIPQ